MIVYLKIWFFYILKISIKACLPNKSFCKKFMPLRRKRKMSWSKSLKNTIIKEPWNKNKEYFLALKKTPIFSGSSLIELLSEHLTLMKTKF